jgi:hypothetical protein
MLRLNRFAARFRAWPLAWPSPLGPLGRQRSLGSRVGACAHRLGDATRGSALDAGGAAPDNARRSGPGELTFLSATGALSAMPDDHDQLAPRGVGDVAAGPVAAGGGEPYAAAAADVGPASEGRGEAAAPQRRDPADPGRSIQVIPAALLSPRCSRLLA